MQERAWCFRTWSMQNSLLHDQLVHLAPGSTREGEASQTHFFQGLRLFTQGNGRPLCSFAVQHIELCPPYPSALVRNGNIFTTWCGQRKQQFPCPSLAVRELIQDVGIECTSLSTCWNSDPSVKFRNGWISSEIGELNTNLRAIM